MKRGYLSAGFAFLLLLNLSALQAQTPEVTRSKNHVSKVLLDAGIAFREGLLAYEDKRLSDAGDKFNKSVEVFVYSTTKIEIAPKLHGCYDKLIETIYRIEFPAENRLPQISNLVEICSWNNLDATLNIDSALVDKIENLVKGQTVKSVRPLLTTVATGSTNISKATKIAFNSQEFEPSPLDELSRLQLTPDEMDIENNPLAQQQYQYIQYAVSNKSLWFIVIKAKAGDTVAKLAKRHRVKAIDVAKFNGLLPNSVLVSGREVKIPHAGTGDTWQNISNRTGVSVADLIAANPGMTTLRGKVFVPVKGNTVNNLIYSRPTVLKRSASEDTKLIGAKPFQAKNGKVSVVTSYFNELLHDPFSMRIVRWSNVTKIEVGGKPYWRVSVKYRAKNRMGAYVLSERVFYIRHNKIVSTFELD